MLNLKAKLKLITIMFFFIVPCKAQWDIRFAKLPFTSLPLLGTGYSHSSKDKYGELLRGEQSLINDNCKEAIASFNRALKLEPNKKSFLAGLIYLDLGCADFNLGYYQEAMSNFNKAMTIGMYVNSWGIYLDAYHLRGQTKFKLYDYRGAIMDFSKCIDEDIYYWDRVGFLRIEARLRLGDTLTALKDLEYMEKNEIGFSLCGDIRFRFKDYEMAVSDFTNSLNQSEQMIKDFNANNALQRGSNYEPIQYVGDTAVYIYRGKAKLMLKDINGACLDWSIAGQYGSSEAYKLIKQHCQ